MKWYVTQLVFRVHISGVEGLAEFEEQLRLLQAPDGREAFEKARLAGQKEAGEVVHVPQGRSIRWEFIDVCMLYELKELLDGAQLSSVTRRPQDADAYIEMTRGRAHHIQNSDTLALLQLA